MDELRDLLFNLRTVHIKAQNKLADLQFQRLLHSAIPMESSQLTLQYVIANAHFEDMDENILPKYNLKHFQSYFKVLRQLNKHHN